MPQLRRRRRARRGPAPIRLTATLRFDEEQLAGLLSGLGDRTATLFERLHDRIAKLEARLDQPAAPDTLDLAPHGHQRP